jgi:hypothetical protein
VRFRAAPQHPLRRGKAACHGLARSCQAAGFSS